MPSFLIVMTFSFGPDVEGLSIVLADCDRRRDLESLRLNLDHLDLLLDASAFGVLYLKLDLWLEPVLLFGLEDDLDDRVFVSF